MLEQSNPMELSKVGNLVFFQSYGPSWFEQAKTKLVQRFTYGRFVHVAVMINETDGIIESALNGIARRTLPKDMTSYTMAQTATVNVDSKGKAHPLDQDRLAEAVEWAIDQISVPYGYLDLAAQAIDIIAPWNTLQLTQSGHYDCSNFATVFLEKAGVWLPYTFKEPYNVSPNDLAEWMGLLPGRNRIKKVL